MAVLSGAACGASDDLPVGRQVAGCPKTIFLNERFQESHRMAILPPPVGADPAGDPSQDVAGQMRHLRPGQEEEADVVCDPTQPLFTLGRCPSNGAVSIGHFPSSSPKPGHGQQPVGAVKDLIADVLPNRTLEAQIVVSPQNRESLGTLFGRVHTLHPQRSQERQGARNGFADGVVFRRGGRNAGLANGWAASTREFAGPTRGQDQQSAPLQLA